MAPSVFAAVLSPTLASLLSTVEVDRLSRTSPSRLEKTALPHISLIELVSGPDFAALYDGLYVSSFPRRTEREDSGLIVERLAAQAAGLRDGKAPYRIVGIRDAHGEAIGAAQFSVLPVPPGKHGGQPLGRGGLEVDAPGEGETYAVPYLQYVYVRPQNRRQDMSEVLHTMVLAVATADAAMMDRSSLYGASPANLQRTVPFTLFETEPPDHGTDAPSRAYALERSKIHTSTGGVALVLRSEKDGEILSAHVQPGLEPEDPPLTLVWVLRRSPAVAPGSDYDVQKVAPLLVAAYYQSLRDEGFPEANIALAERMVEARRKESAFALIPLADVRDFIQNGHLELYQAN